MELKNPYRGLSDEDVLALSVYQEEALFNGRENIIVVTHRETGEYYFKKLLTAYDKSIYSYLMEHPVRNMPRIVDIFESKVCLIVIEECIAGKTLAKILEDGPMSLEQTVYVAKNVCRILDELHSLDVPIIHRDIKPSNIMIAGDSEVYVLDVNVAKWYDSEKSDDTRYMGTQFYAAPEQVGFGLYSSSPKTDIYAVGMMLNVMLTGEFPKEKKAEGPIWDIINRCISLDADNRYTAKELIEALDTIGR
jgi:serine/threonine protein kinase